MKKTHQKEIKKVVNQIIKKYKPEKVILFGSFAWGKPTADSDVDLFIVKKSKKTIGRRHLELDRLLSKRNIPLDFLVYTPKELNKRLKLGDFFIKNINEQGKILYEK